MITLKKCVRQTVTVQLILLVESNGLIVELHISSCLATLTAGRYCYEQNEISSLCIVGYILYVSLMLVFIVHFSIYMYEYIGQYNGEWLIVTANY